MPLSFKMAVRTRQGRKGRTRRGRCRRNETKRNVKKVRLIWDEEKDQDYRQVLEIIWAKRIVREEEVREESWNKVIGAIKKKWQSK